MNQESKNLTVKEDAPKKSASAFIDEAFMSLINWGVRSQDQTVSAKENQQSNGK